MRPNSLLLLAALVSPSVAPAQSAVADARAHWRAVSGHVLQTAIDVPEEKYSYKPTPGVRSFGELFAHVAGAQSMFCAMALGQTPPSEDAIKATTKAALIDAVKRSNKDCEVAYAQSDAAASARIDVFGEQRSRLYALMMNAIHDGEHYGNLITYLRMNGMVPPSSRPMGSASPPPTPDATLVARTAMIRVLTNLRTAQEVFFTDSNRYTPKTANLRMGAMPEGVTFKSLELSKNGNAWVAIVVSSRLPNFECGMAVNAMNPLNANVGEGEPACRMK